MVLLLLAGCVTPAEHPSCAPGTGLAVATDCRVAMEADLATLEECDARVTEWEKRCQR